MSNNYAENVAAGLCGGCGAAPPAGGRKTCDDCAAKVSRARRGLRRTRRAMGLCAECEAPAPGVRRCPRCAAAHRGYVAAARARKAGTRK